MSDVRKDDTTAISSLVEKLTRYEENLIRIKESIGILEALGQNLMADPKNPEVPAGQTDVPPVSGILDAFGNYNARFELLNSRLYAVREKLGVLVG